MTRRDVAWRLGGLLALVAAGGTSFLHRALTANIDGPPSSLEFVLGLSRFMLASFGVLLIFHGARLRDDWVHDCTIRQEARNAAAAGRTEISSAITTSTQDTPRD